MAAVRRVDTAPETRVRSALHRRGYRFRKDYALRIDGTMVRPDIVFTAVKLAVFIDGCFWHRCPQHATAPKSNAAFWREKLDGNQARDRRQDALLESNGWTVRRFWEHEDWQIVSEAIATAVDEARRDGSV